MKNITSTTEKETIALGQKLGEACVGGEVFALEGDLGAGKTCLSKGIALGLRVGDKVNSPTFNIMKVYKAKKGDIKHFCHIDAYRLDEDTNLENIGIDEYLYKKDTVCVIEWAERIKKVLSKDVKVIRLEHEEENVRRIVIE